MGTIKMKDKTAEAVSNLDAQILKNIEIAEKEQAKNAKWEEPTLAGALYEEKSMRGENTKLWRMNDGTMRQIISPNAIHYRDASGELQEIDNRLHECDNEFCNICGERKLTFAKDASNSDLLKIQKGKTQLSWGLCKEPKLVLSILRSEACAIPQSAIAAVNNANGNVIYGNVEDGVDIAYELAGSNVKENIIVKEKRAEYRFDFKLQTQGLTVALSEDNRRIELLTTHERADGVVERNVEYTIPEPFMYDANGERNNEVFYEIEESADGQYIFSVIAESEWINADERSMVL